MKNTFYSTTGTDKVYKYRRYRTWLGQSWSRLWTSRTRGYTACSYIKGEFSEIVIYLGIKMYKKHISSEIT
jgi:hypothetical protein